MAKFVFKKLSTEFTTFQLISKWCNRLQYIGNRLPVCLNVEIQIQLWIVTSIQASYKSHKQDPKKSQDTSVGKTTRCQTEVGNENWCWM